jgi:hypothetical protein
MTDPSTSSGQRPIPIDRELAFALAEHLMAMARGGIPDMMEAANLLRRLNDAIRHSRPTTPTPPAAAGSGG